MLEYFGLLVEGFNNRGENEEELFKNYSKKISRYTIKRCLTQNFLSVRMIEKDNTKANEYYESAKAAYNNLEYSKSIHLYTKSLSHANYYSQDFVRALTGRLVVSHAMHDYKSCIQDETFLRSSTLEKSLRKKINLIVQNCWEKVALSNEPDIIQGNPKSNIEELNCSSSNFKFDRCRVTAKKTIKTGDTVFVTKPYSMTPVFCDDIAVNGYCQNCFLETESLLPCKTCVESRYCSQNCQKEAWVNFHQWECFGIRAGFFKLSDIQLPALRAVFKGLECNFETDSLLEISTGFLIRENSQLIEAAAVALVTVAYLKENSSFFETLKTVPIFSTLTEEETVTKLGGKFIRCYLQLLSYMISVQTVTGEFPTMVTYATAICPLYSKFEHSCKPNTAVYFVDGLMYVRAVKDISENEEIFVFQKNVSILKMDLEKRQESIRKCMGFSCTCSACTYSKINELYICSKCQEGSALPDDDNITCFCLNCDFVFQISAKCKENKNTIKKLLEMYDILGNVEFLNKSLTIGTKIFGFKNKSLLDIYDKLIHHYMDTDNHAKFLQMVNESLKTRVAIFGDISLKLGHDLCLHTVYILQFIKKRGSDANLERYKTLVERAVDFIENLKVIFEIIHRPFLKTIEEMGKTAEELRFFCLSAYLLKGLSKTE